MIVDYIFLGIILLFATIGLLKGFIKSIISFFKGTTGFVISALLVKPISALLANFKLNELLAKLIGNFQMVSYAITEESFNTLLDGGTAVGGNVIGESMTGKVAFLIKTFFSKLFTEEVTYASYAELSNSFNFACGTILEIVLSFILIYVGISIGLSIINKIFTNSAGGRRFGAIDRILGLLFGILRAGLVIVIAMFLLNVLNIIPVVGNALNNMVEQSKFVVIVYEKITDIFTKLVTNIDFNSLVKSLITKA